MFDLGHIGYDEPFKRLVNQGMIGGISEKIIRREKDEKSEGDTEIIREGANQIDGPNSLQAFSSNTFLVKWHTKQQFFLRPDNVDNRNEMNYYIFNISADLDYQSYETSLIRTPLINVNSGNLDIAKYFNHKSENYQYYSQDRHEIFVCEYGYYDSKRKKWFDFEYKEIAPLKFKTAQVPEKMSKRYGNVVNPDDIIFDYGADTFRMYEMFLGPVEQSKPWDTKGIEGVHRFLRKLWRLFFDDIKGKVWVDGKASDAELKVLHKTIKKIEEDTERFSFNTAVSTFMICVNELSDIKCHKKEVLENVLILLTPYAPHIAEELWNQLGYEGTILDATYPSFNPALLVESSKEYPVSINGKVRTNINLSLDLQQADVEKIISENEIIQKWLEGKAPKKVIYVKNKMINVVI